MSEEDLAHAAFAQALSDLVAVVDDRAMADGSFHVRFRSETGSIGAERRPNP